MKIRSRHCPDQKRQCLHLIVTIQWNFLPISNALQHLTTPTSPSRHQCPDLTVKVLLSPKHAKLVPLVQDSACTFTPSQDALSCLLWASAQTSPPQGPFSSCVCVCVCTHMISPLLLFATLWTVACQASLSLGLSRQDYWSGLPFPPPGDLPGTTFYHTALLLFIDYHLRQWFISIPLFTFEFNVC